MANPYELFKTDEKAEVEQGVILDYGDFRIKVARAGGSNKKFGKLLTARLKPYKRQIDTDTMDEEVATRVMIETYADTIILGFEVKAEKGFVPGVPSPDGKVLPYNRDNVIRIFTDLPELFRDVQVQANQVSLFRASEQEETVKN